MNNKHLPQSCGNCRYRNVSIFDGPCNFCRHSFYPGGDMDCWRKRRCWQTPNVTRILAALMALAALVALLVFGKTTAIAAGFDDELTARQEEVHAAAELLRELGVAEEDAAIKALSVEWWRCERLRGARYLGVYTVTGYDIDCPHCQGKYVNQSASGVQLTPGRSVAMCKDFPFGTEIYIEGLGFYVVEDRGVGPGQIDVACSSHSECYALTGHYEVWVLK